MKNHILIKRSMLGIATIFIGIIFAFTACESSTNSSIEESFKEIKSATPISGVQIESLEILRRDNQDSFLGVRLNNGIEREAWCIEWDEEEAFGIQNGVKLYSTAGHKEWEELNYFMRIKMI